MLESCQVAAFSNLPGRRGCAGPRQFPSGAQFGPAAVEALGVHGGVTNAATVYRVNGTPLPSGASVADLFAAPRVELRWKNTAWLGDLSGDTDSDGLTDADELFLYGTDPRRADTDGDGLPDASEILTGANPFDADEDGDGVPDGIPAETWTANPLWATNAPPGAAFIAITLNDAIPAHASASLLVGDLCIPLRSPGSWTFGLVPGDSYPYRLTVHGDTPANLSIGPGNDPARPLLRNMDAASLALWLDGMGGTFDGCSFGGSGNMAVPTLNVLWQDPGDGSHEGTAGGVCLHGGTETSFSPVLRPESIRERWQLSGLEERSGSLVLSIPSEGMVFSGAADLFTDRIRFGVVRALVSAHRCDAAATHPRCSVCGFWIQLDTITDQYVIGTLAEGPYLGPSTNGSMRLPPRPRDSPHGPEANDPGALYTVGHFHTHTPRTYIAPTNQFRWVGPSERDYSSNPTRYVSGIVYDYVGVLDPEGGATNLLYNGHDKNAPAKLYPIPPERRPTP